MNASINFHKIVLLLTFWWGVTISMPAMKVANLAVSNFIILLMIFCICMNGKLKINLKMLILLVWPLLMLITWGINQHNISNMYLQNSFNMVIKVVFMIVGVCIAMSYDQENTIKAFLDGILMAGYIQAVWMLLEYIFYYALGLSFNDLVLGDIFNISIDEGMFLTIKDGLFRPCGIGWDSSMLGMSFLLSFILSKNINTKVLFALCVLFSTSRQAMLGLLVVILVDFFVAHKISYKTVITFVVVIFLGVLIAIFKGDLISTIFDSILSRFGSVFLLFFDKANSDNSSLRHLSYYFEMVEIFKQSSILQIIFGWGTFSAGYPYSNILGIYTWLTYVWTPESDFVTMFVGNGIAGGLFYYGLMLWFYLKRKVMSNEHKRIILVIFICGLLYFFARSMMTVTILLFVFCYYYSKNAIERT